MRKQHMPPIPCYQCVIWKWKVLVSVTFLTSISTNQLITTPAQRNKLSLIPQNESRYFYSIYSNIILLATDLTIPSKDKNNLQESLFNLKEMCNLPALDEQINLMSRLTGLFIDMILHFIINVTFHFPFWRSEMEQYDLGLIHKGETQNTMTSKHFTDCMVTFSHFGFEIWRIRLFSCTLSYGRKRRQCRLIRGWQDVILYV